MLLDETPKKRKFQHIEEKFKTFDDTVLIWSLPVFLGCKASSDSISSALRIVRQKNLQLKRGNIEDLKSVNNTKKRFLREENYEKVSYFLLDFLKCI